MKKLRILLLVLVPLFACGQGGILNSYNFGGWIVLLVRGDSIAQGSGEEAGPTTSAGRIYEWDQTNDIPVDRATTEFSPAVDGTVWKQMAIDLADRTGKRILVINCGLSGAEVFPNGGTDTHWAPNYDNAGASVPDGTGSALYNNTLTEVAACLAYVGKSSLDGICDIVGVNDARGSAALADIQNGFTSLYDKTNTDFPGVPIYVCTLGSSELNTIDQRKGTIKRYIRVLADNRSYYHIVCNLLSLSVEGWNLYQADLLHPSQDGNNVIGGLYARYITSSESNKEVRQVFNAFKDELSSTHQAAVKTWVEALQAVGDWAKLESFIPAVGSTKENVLVDLRFLSSPADAGFTFNANSNIRIFGTSNHRRTRILPAYSWVSATQNDFMVGVKVATNSTAAGTNAYLIGVLENSPVRQIVIAQLVTNNLQYYANDNTASTDATHTSIQNNTLYSVYRTGTTKGLKAGSTTLASVTQVSTGFPTLNPFEGVRNNAGTPQTPIDATIEYSYQCQFASFDLSTFISATATLITALQN